MLLRPASVRPAKGMKFMNKQIAVAIVLVLVIFSLGTTGFAQMKRTAAVDSSSMPLFAIEDLRPGMKGVARTVFSGSEPQEFGLEILGVLDGFTGPRQSTIIAKLNGPNVDKTGVFAGMSGSPVFIANKLVGAIAYSFPFAKEPICGITPIKQMIDIFEQGNDRRQMAEPRAVSFASLASAEWKAQLPKQAVTPASLVAQVATNSALVPLMGQQIQPIATPVVFSGIKQETLNL